MRIDELLAYLKGEGYLPETLRDLMPRLGLIVEGNRVRVSPTPSSGQLDAWIE